MLSENPEETQGKFKHRTILKVKLHWILDKMQAYKLT
jgi:hypothetical protein